MKLARLILSVIGVVLAVALVLQVQQANAAPGECVVEPNPVYLTGENATPNWTVTVDGGTPGVWYEIGLFQKGNGLRDERRLDTVQADADGVVTRTFPVYNQIVGLPYSLWPGQVKVEIKSYRVGGKVGPKLNERLGTCYFTVIE